MAVRKPDSVPLSGSPHRAIAIAFADISHAGQHMKKQNVQLLEYFLPSNSVQHASNVIVMVYKNVIIALGLGETDTALREARLKQGEGVSLIDTVYTSRVVYVLRV